MSTQTPPACADGISTVTLSAWRDDRLSLARASRLVVHLAQCAACQARLAEYDALAQLLRAQTVPGPDTRLRRTLRARIARIERTAAPRWPRPLLLAPRVRRLLGAVGAIAAALLLVAGFARLLGANPLLRATGQPTATAALHWHAATLPPGFGAAAATGQSLDFAPSDGNTAYACVVPAQTQRGQPLLWVSRDRAAHWAALTRVPTTGAIATCLVAIDTLNPAVVAVSVIEANASGAVFLTTDGAATWRDISAPGLTGLDRTSTLAGTTYALAIVNRTNTAQPLTRLIVTTDQFRTWRPIDLPRGDPPQAFWVNPANGALLAQTAGGLWDSADGGQQWSALPVSPVSLAPTASGFSYFALSSMLIAVQTPTANQPWRLCAEASVHSGQTPDTPIDHLACTTDGGRTWVPRPAQLCATCPADSQFGGLVLAGDGALLVSAPATGGGIALYRLPAGGQRWQALGMAPLPKLAYVSTPGAGVLWAYASPELVAQPLQPLSGIVASGTAAIATADSP
ncbi:MAG TPA: hypothetical protein VGN32_17960 [Ktedonobacterales bacterium]|nr:hypothetical protein [Ktedonobacterales bacterium]